MIRSVSDTESPNTCLLDSPQVNQVTSYGEFNGLLLGHDRLRDLGALPFTG